MYWKNIFKPGGESPHYGREYSTPKNYMGWQYDHKNDQRLVFYNKIKKTKKKSKWDNVGFEPMTIKTSRLI